jgi:hypothetical protein
VWDKSSSGVRNFIGCGSVWLPSSGVRNSIDVNLWRPRTGGFGSLSGKCQCLPLLLNLMRRKMTGINISILSVRDAASDMSRLEVS